MHSEEPIYLKFVIDFLGHTEWYRISYRIKANSVLQNEFLIFKVKIQSTSVPFDEYINALT